jgi:hypothetical protein
MNVSSSPLQDLVQVDIDPEVGTAAKVGKQVTIFAEARTTSG